MLAKNVLKFWIWVGGVKIDLLCFEAFITNAKKSIKKLNIKQGKYNNKEFTMQILKTKNPFWTMWAKIIKKDIYLKAFNMLNLKKEIKINMAEDALLYYPLTILSNEIFYLTQPLYTQHVNSNSITNNCLLYTSPSPRDYAASRMPSSA